MQFEIPHCPACSRSAAYIWEVVPVKQSILQDEDGEFDYHDCHEDPCWEGSEIERDEDGTITLQCDAGHDWQTRFADDA